MADKGTYYLLESTRSGDIVKAVHKRVGVEAVGFELVEGSSKSDLAYFLCRR
jgi:hypothetical protein